MTPYDVIDEDNARAVLDGLDLPVDWRIHLAGYVPRLMTIGESGAVVIRLASDDRRPLFLKADSGPFAEVPAEAERLLASSHAALTRAALNDPSITGRASDAAGRLAALRAAQGRTAEAARLRAPARTANRPES